MMVRCLLVAPTYLLSERLPSIGLFSFYFSAITLCPVSDDAYSFFHLLATNLAVYLYLTLPRTIRHTALQRPPPQQRSSWGVPHCRF